MTQADQTLTPAGRTVARGMIDMFVDAPVLPAGMDRTLQPLQPSGKPVRGMRWQMVAGLIDSILQEKGRARILDLDGRDGRWLPGSGGARINANRVEITQVCPEGPTANRPPWVTVIEGHAADPRLLAGCYFDLVLCGPVIGKVGDWSRMQIVADNIRRLAPRYCVEAPNFWFPHDPHFQMPGFQFLPLRLRTALMMRMALGSFPRMTSWSEARIHVEQHRLLTVGEVKRLFPDAGIRRERRFGLTRSLLAMRG